MLPHDYDSFIKTRPQLNQIDKTNAALWFPYKWPKEMVNLYVNFQGGSPYVRGKVIQFAKKWEEVAAVRFHFGNHTNPAIIISFKPGGSWSQLGKASAGINPSMNFGWFNDQTNDLDFESTVVHEFGHALGLIHEHQSPNNNPIQWNVPEVYRYFRAQGWTDIEIRRNVLDRYNADQLVSTTHDPTSIMHYSIPSFLTTNGYSTPWNYTMSNQDKQVVGLLYYFEPQSNWYLNNLAGQVRGPINIPVGSTISSVQIREQYGYGIIDLRLELTSAGSTSWTNWLANNPNSNVVHTAKTPANSLLIGFDVYEQSGFGIIDLAPVYRNTVTNVITRGAPMTKNPNAHRTSYHSITDSQQQIKSLKVREQSGYGLVNISRE